MGVFNLSDALRSRSCLDAAGLLALLLLPAISGAAEFKQGEIQYSADQIKTELRSNTLELVGNVSVEQGKNAITADHGRLEASGDINDARFEGSVRVHTTEAELRAGVVDASIVKGALSSARAEGSPAEFRQLSGPADSRGEGRARIIEYDVNAGEVKLTGGAEPVWFLYGKDKNELRTDVLTYNMRTGTVSTGRTRGTIRLNGQTGRSDGRGTEAVKDRPGTREDGA